VWRGADGASGLVADQIAFWNRALATATASDMWRTAIERGLWSPLYVDGKNLHARLARERAEMQSILGALELLRAG
jgi:tripartite-type tricarboxylate transporter receptor subunit TctC